MNNFLLKKEMLYAIRLISLFCALFMISVEVYKFSIISEQLKNDSISIFLFLRHIGNITVIILFVILSIYPYKTKILAWNSFYYAFLFLAVDADNPLGVCMFFLGLTVLYARGFFIIKTRRRIYFAILMYIILLLLGLHLGCEVFFNALLIKIEYSIVLGIIGFLLVGLHKNLETENKKTLVLSEYTDLIPADVDLLKKVLENKLYKIIAIEVNKAEGTVRNRLNKVYDILGVMDRTGFISTYMGYNIIFSDDEKSETEDK